MLDLNEEKKIFNQGHDFIGAIDEAGRGPLAGPVVAACLIIKSGQKFSPALLKQVKDSKKLSAKKRQEVYKLIKEEGLEIGLGISDHQTIDRINILQASFLAMKKAIGALRQKPDYIILDGGFLIPNASFRQKNIIKGDSTVFSIAAASIVAKVERDLIMEKMHRLYPAYGFNQHKGYGTKIHLERLKSFGPSPIHRRSFAPIKNK